MTLAHAIPEPSPGAIEALYATGHWLYSQQRIAHALTVFRAMIHIAPDDEQAPAEMRGIGIRIEDDVLVTAAGYEVLSAAVPKQIPEVEALTTA